MTVTPDLFVEKSDEGRWIVRLNDEHSEQRFETLKRVAQEIVERQLGFLEAGPNSIAPIRISRENS